MEITKYTKHSLDKIKSSSVLDNEDISSMLKMDKSMQHVFEKRQIYRTETEMKYSVLDELRCPTIQARYWQIIREEFSMFNNLMQISFEYEDLNLNLQLSEIELKEIDDSAKGKIYAMKKRNEIKKLQFESAIMRVQAKDYVRELKIWEKLKAILISKGGFDLNDCNADQFETLKQKWENQNKIAKEFGHESLGKVSQAGIDAIQKDVFTKIPNENS